MLNWLTYKILAWVAVGLGAVTIGLSVALWAQNVRVGKAQNDRDAAINDRDAAINRVEQAIQTIEVQKGVLKECSDRTDALKAEGDKRQAVADQAVATAREEARRYVEANKRRAVLLAAPTPPGAGCQEALVDLRRGLGK